MSTTIDSLDIQISASASAAEVKLDALANALKRLRDNSGLTKVTNGLEKLSKALNTLRPAVAGLNVSKLRSLGDAMKSMASIQKLSGLNSALNTLKKIPDVIAGLDEADLNKFSAQMSRLADAMSPLVTKVNALATGFAKLPSQVSKTVTATNRMTSASGNLSVALDTTNVNIMAKIANLMALVQAVQHFIQVASGFLAQAIEWDGIQFRFGRAFAEDAEEVYQYVLKVNEVLGINIQQLMQYSSLYGSLLSGFGMAQEKVTTISVGLTELSYDIWAAYNDRFKTLEDASEAVRSAITGEIEPIRNAGIALTEASLQEYIDSTHLAGVSIEKLTEAQKSEVRYAAMVNAALNQGIVGTYAREMNTAEGAVRSLSQSMKGLYQALGSLFIPILQVAVPYVTAFVELITDAVFWVAELFGIPMQEISWDNNGVKGLADGAETAAGGLGDAAKAAKKLKDYTMGFDELNVISPDSGSAGAGGAGAGDAGWGAGLDLETLWDDSVFAQASAKVDEIKEKVKAFFGDWKTQTVLVLASAKVLFSTWSKISSIFSNDWIKNLASGLKALKGGQISTKTFLQGITGGLTTQNFMSSAKDIVLRFGGALKTAFTKLPSLLVNVVKAIPGWGWVIAAISAVIALAVVDFDFTDIGYKIGHALGTMLKNVGKWLGAAGEWIVSVGKSILGGINDAWEWVKDEFDIKNVFELIILMFSPQAWITKIVPKMLEIGAEVLPGLWQGIKDGWNNFWGNIEEFIDGFIQGFKDALEINSPSKVFSRIGTQIIAGLLGGVTEKWKDLKKWFNTDIAPKLTKEYWVKRFDGIRTAIGTKLDEVKAVAAEKWGAVKRWYADKVAPKFTKEYWVTKFNGLKDGFTQTIKNAVNSGIDLINRFIGWINSSLSFSWDGLSIAGKTVYEGGSVQLFTIPTIPKFANGGFIEDGLFTMNSGEIAGKFNNGKSVVANNEQIIAGIAEGVYSAVVAAMNETQRSGDQNVNVYLDGKQIYASVKKTESQRGRTLMGNQLGYSY